MFVWYPNQVTVAKATASDLANPFSNPVVRRFVGTMRSENAKSALRELRAELSDQHENW